MSYRLLRFLVALAGCGALAGFGWRFYEFIRHKKEFLAPFDLATFVDAIPIEGSSRQASHLRPYEDYQLLHVLNVTGILPPEDPIEGPKAPPPPIVGPQDLRLVFLSLGIVPKAYLTPALAPAQPSTTTGGLMVIAGGLYGVGERFDLPTKPGVQLEVLAIRPDEVEIGIVGKDDSAFVLRRGEAVGDLTQIQAGGAVVVRRPFPSRTVPIGGDLYDVGTEDLRELAEMSEDQILASIVTQPKRDQDNNVVGQRVTRLQEDSPLARFGLRQDDVVLDVNGIPASDRAVLLRRLREMGDVDEISVRLERLGAERTYTYRVPPRR